MTSSYFFIGTSETYLTSNKQRIIASEQTFLTHLIGFCKQFLIHAINSVTKCPNLIREMTVRHLFTKLKPQLSDFLESWSNYNKVIFEFVICFNKCLHSNPQTDRTFNRPSCSFSNSSYHRRIRKCCSPSSG